MTPASPVAHDRRVARRAARQAANRADILDAAERVLAEHGFVDGSVRRIAAEAGYSSGAVYLFFDSKDQLVTETLIRRGDELVAAISDAAGRSGSPLGRLHDVVDVTADFFAGHAHFARLLGHLGSGQVLMGSRLAGFDESAAGFRDATELLTGLVREGQDVGEVRAGPDHALARLFAVIVNEFVLLRASRAGADSLTRDQLHDIVDGALRAPPGL